ncbi:hypothetical protein [Streptomyces bobili]|uniref:hypothetical protein n=1 Tax=Streptomyces bobili TaxID=67280 RepID=UPI003719E189
MPTRSMQRWSLLGPRRWRIRRCGPRGRRKRTVCSCWAVCSPKAELEITAATRLPEEEEIEDVLDTLLGWTEQVGPDPGLAANVLTNRLQRTAMQVAESEADEPPPGRAAAFAAVMTAVYVLSAQMHAERGEVKGTRQALGGAEEALIDILQGMHDLRILLGDAPAMPEE